MKRPLVETNVRAHLGEAQETNAFQENPDFTFVKGYSEKRREMDAARAKGLKGPKLGYRLQWVRVKDGRGNPEGMTAARFRMMGYREVRAAELAELGLEMPIGGVATADGFIDTADVRLFMCDAKTAARNEMNWRRATDEMQATDRAPQLEAEGRKFARPGEELTFAEGAYTSPEPDAG